MSRTYINTGNGTVKIVDSVESPTSLVELQAEKDGILARKQAELDSVDQKYAPQLAEVQAKIDGSKAVGVEVTAEIVNP